MTEALAAEEFRAKLRHLEGLIQSLEEEGDPSTRARVRDVLQAVLDLHAVGLERILGHMTAAGEGGRDILDACAADEVAAGLLLLHGLHPQDVETRVRAALEKLRPRLRKTGGDVELLGVEGGVVRLRIDGDCDVLAVEEAVYAAAPDAESVKVTGGAGGNGKARLPLPVTRG